MPAPQVVTIDARDTHNTLQLLRAERGMGLVEGNVELRLGWPVIKGLKAHQGVVLETKLGTWIGHVFENPGDGDHLLLVDLM